MSLRCNPEKVCDFFVKRRGRRYCDNCVRERLGLRWRQQVQLITATLAVTPAFARGRGECFTCHEIKQVTWAVAASSTDDGPIRNNVRSNRPKLSSVRPAAKLVLSALRS
jgi:hypothetical protein